MKTLSYDMQNFRAGLVLLNDDSTSPVGSAREMTNVFITDRGGIAPRPGTRLLGPYNDSTSNGNGFYVFKKSYDDIEIPMRAYDDELEYYCSICNQWARLKNGFTPDKEFGFAYNFVTTENEDYVYFCNQFQPFSRWNGQVVHLTAPIVLNSPVANIVGSTNATPIAITTAAPHGFVTGDSITIAGHLYNTPANGTWSIIVTGPNTFTLTGSVGIGLPVNIASSTNASPIAVTTATPHSYTTGDNVTIAGHLVNTNANGTWNIIVTGPSTFTLTGSVGNGIGAATGNVRKNGVATGTTLKNVSIIPVSSVLRPDVFSTRTAIGTPTNTTVQQSGETWGTNQWRNMWVYFTSGIHNGRIRKISSNTADTLTFAALPTATAVAIASSTNASPIQITTSTPHGYSTGNRVLIASHLVNTAANGYWDIIVTGPSTFTLTGSTGNGVGAASGTSTQQLLVPGDTFEVRVSRYDISTNSKFIYNGTEITVTAIDKYNELTVVAAHAAPDGTPLTNSPQEYPAAPRGNRMTVLKGRTFVSRVRSGLSRDTGGTDQGANVGSTLFGTRLTDPTSFTFSATRVASEGIIAAVPFGGTEINDIAMFEDVVYVYKRAYIEAFQMGDTDDAVLRRPLKAEAGSVNRVIVGRDDHYFITLDKQFTSLGRVEGKDFTPTTQNIGLPIKRLLDRYEFDKVNGIEYRNRLLFSAKSDGNAGDNNSTIVWNKTTQTFEGAWNIGAHGFGTYLDELYYQESASPNVWKLFETKKSDFSGATELPISAKWQSNFYNLTPIKANYQGANSFAFEGFIAANAIFTVSLYKDFSAQASIEFDFGGLDDEAFLVGDDLASFLGANPLGLEPIGTVDAPGSDGRRRFQFLVYFPPIYGQYFSIGFSSSGVDQDWEIIRASLGVRESISTVRPNIRQAL